LRPADFAVMTTTAVLLNVRHDLATLAGPGLGSNRALVS
jgi:hypothetical protein